MCIGRMIRELGRKSKAAIVAYFMALIGGNKINQLIFCHDSPSPGHESYPRPPDTNRKANQSTKTFLGSKKFTKKIFA
jgi:hypothetical protein